MDIDVYLAGYADAEWREDFKERIARDITIYDPFIQSYESLNTDGKAEQVAREFESIDNCKLIIFYLCKEWDSHYSMIQLGDAVGKGKQVVVHVELGMDSAEKITRYCEYRGIIVVNIMEDLVENVEEFLAQSEMAESLDLD